MRQTDAQVVAIACADIHLSHKPPIIRCPELDWYAVQRRVLKQLRSIVDKYRVPLIIAGDLFDDGWRPTKCPPELINLALLHLPECYVVVGQHDIPHHRFQDLKKSAIFTLASAGKVILLGPKEIIEVRSSPPLRLHGFHWKVPISPCESPHDLILEIAVVHQYVWSERKKNSGYVGVTEDKELGSLQQNLQGYDVVVFGDNHQPFTFSKKDERGMSVINCGSLMRRKKDEINHKPSVGLIYSDGTVKRHYLDCSQDKFLEESELDKILGSLDMEDLITELGNLGDVSLDFREAVSRCLGEGDFKMELKDIIFAALERKR